MVRMTIRTGKYRLLLTAGVLAVFFLSFGCALLRPLVGPAGRKDIRASAISVHVSTRGNDAWAGTEERPFATLVRARDVVRALRAAGPAAGPVTVWLHGGTYLLDRGLVLAAEDSGTTTSPVLYRCRREKLSG